MTAAPAIELARVSKFYGEVLGVNKINLKVPAGITSLVGPNGSGKTTLMNLMTGLVQPSAGEIRVRGVAPSDPERFYPMIGYSTQFDSFPKGITGYELLESILFLHGWDTASTRKRAWETLERVGLANDAGRKVAGYSKGMRQRIKLATAIAHDPEVLVLDEPLNGLDPMARAEFIALFQGFATEGRHVIVSSHILHEVDMISDQVIMMSFGYVVAEGQIQGVRSEIAEHPTSILVRCDRPALIAQRVFSHGNVVEARIMDEPAGVLVRTRDTDAFYALLNRMVLDDGIEVEGVAPTDEDIHSVYNYLLGSNGRL